MAVVLAGGRAMSGGDLLTLFAIAMALGAFASIVSGSR
jgi:hypothetical protein